MQLQNASSLEDARRLLDIGDYDARFDLGFAKPAQSFTQRNIAELVQGVCDNVIIYQNKISLDQFVQGLQCHDALKLISVNVPLAKWLFSYSESTPVDCQLIRNIFKTVPSPAGSNRRSKEEELIFHWYQFLSDVQDGQVAIGMYRRCLVYMQSYPFTI